MSRCIPPAANSRGLSDSLGVQKHFYVHSRNENILVSLPFQKRWIKGELGNG